MSVTQEEDGKERSHRVERERKGKKRERRGRERKRGRNGIVERAKIDEMDETIIRTQKAKQRTKEDVL